jgi:hypothetical protein
VLWTGNIGELINGVVMNLIPKDLLTQRHDSDLHKKYNTQIMISVWPKFYVGTRITKQEPEWVSYTQKMLKIIRKTGLDRYQHSMMPTTQRLGNVLVNGRSKNSSN